MSENERKEQVEFLRQILGNAFNSYEHAIDMHWTDLERVLAGHVVDIDFKIAELLHES